MYKLEKKMKFYKNQMDDLVFERYEAHVLDRLSIDLDALVFRAKYMIKQNKDLGKLKAIEEEFSEKSLAMRKIFGELIEFLLIDKLHLGNEKDIIDIMTKDIKIDSVHMEFVLILISENKSFLEKVDNTIQDDDIYNLYPDKFFRFYTDSYNDGIAKAYPELFENKQNSSIGVGHDHDVFVHNFTFQTSERCSLQCSPAGTKILMADYSYKNIEDIAKDDLVLAFNDDKNLVASRVVATGNRMAKCLKITHAEIGEAYFTPEHPILSAKNEWIDMGALSPCDGIQILKDGKIVPLFNYVIEEENKEIKVYNFETTTNTYISNNILVHNCTYCFTGDTMVRMWNDSYTPIKDLKPGDRILGFDEKVKMHHSKVNLKKMTFRNSTVEKLNKRISAGYYKITHPLLSRPLKVTAEHPILTEYGWMPAYALNFDIGIILVDSNDMISALYHYKCKWVQEKCEVYNMESSSKTFIANTILAHNCYQFNKSPMRMDFNIAKMFIDKLLNDEYGYINRYNSPAIILEFIGGEPLMEIKLTRKIYEYFLDRAYELNHPWFKLHRVSICSNGLQYFDEDVQSFFSDYVGNISFNISIDGNKELHDACRIQPNGEGSYDIDMMALNHFNKHFTPERNSKMTLAPQNMKYLFESVKSFIDNGMLTINLNCIFEEGWNRDTALLEYNELKKLADHILENDLEHLYISIFNERQEDVQEKSMDGNFCFRGDMMVLTPRGNIPVASLKLDDLVYTASGNIHRVTYLSKRYSTENRILFTDDAPPIRCTYDHKFFAKKKMPNGYTAPSFVSLNELTEGDYIAYPILEFNGNELTPEIAGAIGYFLSKATFHDDTIIIEYSHLLDRAGLKYSQENAICYLKIEDNLEFYNLCDMQLSEIIAKIINSSKEAARAFVDQCPLLYFPLDPVSINNLLIIIRSLGRYPKLTFMENFCSISYANITPDNEYSLYWAPIKSIVKDENYDVYCPTLMPIDSDIEEHTIVVNGIAAKQCGAGSASMLALRPNGQFYPCIRYMPTSVGKDKDDLCMGTVDTQMIGRAEGSEIIKMMDRNTRRGQVNDICYNCPIGNDCASCSALGVTVFNNNNKKVTFICIQMIAEALANVYYWNLLSIKHPEYNLPVRKNNVPKEWALLVIDQNEWEFLNKIEIAAMIKKLENE